MKECSYNKFLSEYQDGTLEGSKLLELEKHLDGCEACKSKLEMMKELENQLKELGQHNPDSGSLVEYVRGAKSQDIEVPVALLEKGKKLFQDSMRQRRPVFEIIAKTIKDGIEIIKSTGEVLAATPPMLAGQPARATSNVTTIKYHVEDIEILTMLSPIHNNQYYCTVYVRDDKTHAPIRNSQVSLLENGKIAMSQQVDEHGKVHITPIKHGTYRMLVEGDRSCEIELVLE